LGRHADDGRLLAYWRAHEGAKPFVCQIEAVETIVWLTEVAPKFSRGKAILANIAAANAASNPELYRLAMKMATGAGKTTVMAMLIAWQTANAIRSSGSGKFGRGFLIIAPGVTIRDRLRVLRPEDPDNYTTRELVVVDEAQDLGVPELRFVAAVASAGENGLFLAGDLGQRIFQQPFSWGALGVDIRGRSSCLKVNYRTSHQIRRAADRLLPKEIRDVDGVAEARGGTVSVFNGAEPRVLVAPDAAAEIDAVAAFLMEALASGVDANEIGVFTRRPEELARARASVVAAGYEPMELSERGDEAGGRVSIGVMHLAKGLEFKAVAVMACDDEVLPLQSRIDSVADEVELEDVYETERQLLYVSATRARDRLLISGVAPRSEFLRDFMSARGAAS
jgi:hypothetical protein